MHARLIVSVLTITLLATAVCGQTTPPASQPGAAEFTLPQQDEIYRLLPQDGAIYYLCADRDQAKAEPGGPPVRKSYATYMRYDIKSGTITNVLATIPGRFDAGKLKVFLFEISPDGKHAVMQVNSPSGSNLGGMYMIDLKTQKAKKFLPPGEQAQALWCGNELIMPVRVLDKPGGMNGNTITTDTYSTMQPVRYSAAGGKLGTLPVCGHVWAANPAGDTLIMIADPKALNKPLKNAMAAKLVVISKTGKIQNIVPVDGDRGFAMTYSANLKYGATQAANVTGAKPMKGGGGMPLNAVAFSLDGKATIVELPDARKPTGAVWVGDDGSLLSKDAMGGEVTYWNPKGEKLWSLSDVQTSAVHNESVYYIQNTNPKVIKVKPLVEKAN